MQFTYEALSEVYTRVAGYSIAVTSKDSHIILPADDKLFTQMKTRLDKFLALLKKKCDVEGYVHYFKSFPFGTFKVQALYENTIQGIYIRNTATNLYLYIAYTDWSECVIFYSNQETGELTEEIVRGELLTFLDVYKQESKDIIKDLKADIGKYMMCEVMEYIAAKQGIDMDNFKALQAEIKKLAELLPASVAKEKKLTTNSAKAYYVMKLEKKEASK